MKTPKVVLFACFSLLAASVFAQTVPDKINYQGRLVDGTNLVNGSVVISFRLYSAPTGGLPAYEDSNTVNVVDGLYSAYIGDDHAWGDLTTALMGTQVWVEVVIDGTNVLSPREQIVPVSFAKFANAVPGDAIKDYMIDDNQIYANHIVDGEITEAKIDNGALTGNKIGLGVVGAQHIANNIIDSDKLTDNAVSNAELAVNSVTGDKIVDGTISNADVAANTFWSTTGNAGTTAGTHFLGTTDDRPVDIRANNQRVLRLDNSFTMPNVTIGESNNTINPSAGSCTISGGGGLGGGVTAHTTVTTLYEDDAVWNAGVATSFSPIQDVYFQVQGNGETIRWVATVRTAEVAW